MVYRLLAPAGAALALALVAGQASATVLFQDSFQTGLGQWKPGAAASNPDGGVIVSAPGGGNALAFDRTWAGGDIETVNAFASSTNTFTLSFDVYGHCGATSLCGAFVLGTTVTSKNAGGWFLSDTPFNDTVFPDSNGAWEKVTYTFSANPNLRLSLEDWNGSAHGAPYSFYIKDMVLTDDPNRVPVGTLTIGSAGVPEPATWAMMVLGLAGLGMALRARRPLSGVAAAA